MPHQSDSSRFQPVECHHRVVLVEKNFVTSKLSLPDSAGRDDVNPGVGLLRCRQIVHAPRARSI